MDKPIILPPLPEWVRYTSLAHDMSEYARQAVLLDRQQRQDDEPVSVTKATIVDWERATSPAPLD